MFAPIVVAMVSKEAHFHLPLSRGVLFPTRWLVALPRKIIVPIQPKKTHDQIMLGTQ